MTSVGKGSIGVNEFDGEVRGWRRRSLGQWGAVTALPAAVLLLAVAGLAQQIPGRMSKVPVVNKIDSNAPTRSAFTGSIQLLDRKMKVLDVNGATGQSTAIFPLGKKVKISSVAGAKLKWASLTPGTNVIVYYEMERGRRTVQQIVVLGSGSNKPPLAKKKAHSS
jgi:hypothetical protein